MCAIRVEKPGEFAFTVGNEKSRRIKLKGTSPEGVEISGEVTIEGKYPYDDLEEIAGEVVPDKEIEKLFPDELKDGRGKLNGNLILGAWIMAAGVKFTGIQS